MPNVKPDEVNGVLATPNTVTTFLEKKRSVRYSFPTKKWIDLKDKTTNNRKLLFWGLI